VKDGGGQPEYSSEIEKNKWAAYNFEIWEEARLSPRF
jgi:hypothetical protein